MNVLVLNGYNKGFWNNQNDSVPKTTNQQKNSTERNR